MPVLKRRLDRIDALAVSLGAVIGVGVFRNTGLVLSGADGFAGATAVWLVVGGVCLAGAILYSDLSGRVPEAGGGYAYVRTAFGGPASFEVHGTLYCGKGEPNQAIHCGHAAPPCLFADVEVFGGHSA